jgi:hypothetical protein
MDDFSEVITELRKALDDVSDRIDVLKGDIAGHQFHGNQYSDGGGSNRSTGETDHSARALRHEGLAAQHEELAQQAKAAYDAHMRAAALHEKAADLHAQIADMPGGRGSMAAETLAVGASRAAFRADQGLL